MQVNDYKKIKVLHVDDDWDFLETTKKIVEMDKKIQVKSINSPSKALKMLSTQEFDVVVCDYQMPEKDGLTFLAEIREREENIPFILFTGKGREDVAIKALNLGANQFINKIGDPKTVYGELIHYIKQVFDKKQVEDLLEDQKERVKKIVSQTPAMIYQFRMNSDGSFDIPFSVGAHEDFLGFKSEDLNNNYSPIKSSIYDGDLEKLITAIKESAKNLLPLNCEFRAKVDGQIKWVFCCGNPEKQDDNSILWTGYCVDVSAQKRACREMELQKKMLESVVKNTKSGLSIISKEFEIIFANKVLTDIFGALTGKICYDVLAKRKSPCPNCGVKKIFDKEFDQVVHSRVIKDEKGKEIFLDLIATAIRDENGKITSASEISVDITRHKKIENKLKAQKTQFQDLLDSLPEVIFEMDTTGKLLYVNSKGYQKFGYTKQDFKKGFNVFNIVAEEDRPKLKENVEKLIRGIKSGFNQYRLVKKDGTVFDASIETRPIHQKGSIVGLRGILIDNSEQKSIQKRLLLKAKMLDFVDTAICASDPDGTIKYWNTAAERLFGWDANEVLYKKIRNIKLHNNMKKNNQQNLNQLLKAENAKGTYWFRRKDETTFLGEVTHSPVFNEKGELIAIISSTRDLTKQKLEENILKESEEKFRTLAEQSPNMIFINQDGQIVYANKKCEMVMGYSKDEFYSKDFNFLDLIANRDKGKIFSSFSKHLEGNEVSPVEYTVVTKNGKEISAILNTTLIFYSGRKAILGTVTDITKQKMSEKKLENTFRKLEILNEKLNIVGKSTRHDVANKLAVILNNTYLAKKKLSGEQTEIQQFLDCVENSVGQIKRIFEFSRIYQQLGSEELCGIDVGESFEKAVSSFSVENDLEFKNNCSGLKVIADSFLDVLFYNLIENSLKHGEKVSEIKLNFKKNNEGILIIFEDDGVGIAKEDKKKIFVEGYGSGTGMGLYLIKSMCKIYGWTITEIGEAEKGARFVISVPKLC